MKVILLLLAFFTLPARGQMVPWVEGFDRPTLPPYLEGNLSRFAVKHQRLYLDHPAPAAQNKSHIVRYAPLFGQEDLEWEIDVALDFIPSPQNYLKVFLAASHPDLASSSKAWYLQVGGQSGGDTRLSLIRQSGERTTLLAEGKAISSSTQAYRSRVRIRRTTSGTWTVANQQEGSQSWEIAFSTKDGESLIGFFTGLLLQYTPTRARHFHFDDWKISGMIPDTSKPRMREGKLTGLHQLEMTFTKPLDSQAGNPADFTLADAAGSQIRALSLERDSLDPYRLRVLFPPFQANTPYVVSGRVTDRSQMSSTFSFITRQRIGFPVQRGDLCLSEILPAPQSGKQAEFIELHNISNRTLHLKSLRIRVNRNEDILTELFLDPGEFLVCHPLRDSAVFRDLSGSLGLARFPGLPNTGGTVQLFEGNTELESMRYGTFPQWQHSLSIGHSLERRRCSIPADCLLNWTLHPSGHSAGQTNANQDVPLPAFEPALDHLFPLTPKQVQLFANVPLNLPDTTDLRLFHAFPLPVDSIQSDSEAQIWRLFLKNPVPEKTLLQGILPRGLRNCLGQESSREQPYRLALPEWPAPEEPLFVNEILFDPLPGQKPFLEIMAQTTYPIDLKDLHWGIGNPYPHRLLFPGEPYALTENPGLLAAQYPTGAHLPRILEAKIPNLARLRGRVTLYLGNQEKDIAVYDQDWHSPWLRSPTGISLERAGPRSNGQIASGWSSALGWKTGASPGAANGSARKETVPVDQQVLLEPSAFRPGEQIQICQIPDRYQGHKINIRIFDVWGREVYYLVRNEIWGQGNTIVWTGLESLPLLRGHYIWWVELLGPDGTRNLFTLPSKLE